MNLKNWLCVSLTVNLALLAGIVWLAARPSPRASASASPPAHATAHRATTRAEPPRAEPLAWSDSMAQLRQAGVPSAIIAKVVVENIAQKWTPLEAQAERQYLHDEIDARRLGEFHDERAREEEQALRAALGAGYRDWHKEHIVQNMYLGGLRPAEEQKEPLYVLETDWRKRIHDLEVAKRNGRLDAAAFDAAFAQGEAEYKGALAAIIGNERVYGEPAENDPGAELRQDFNRLQLTDTQIDDLVRVQKKWSDVRGAMADSLAQTKTMDVAYEGDLQAIDRARDEEYRRILGEEAFTAWQRNRDDRYRVLRSQGPSWGLEGPQIERVYELIRAYDLAVATFEHQAQVREQAGEGVDWATVDQSVAAYTQQTEATLRAYLGGERFEKLQSQAVFGFRQPNLARHNPNIRAPSR